MHGIKSPHSPLKTQIVHRTGLLQATYSFVVRASESKAGSGHGLLQYYSANSISTFLDWVNFGPGHFESCSYSDLEPGLKTAIMAPYCSLEVIM